MAQEKEGIVGKATRAVRGAATAAADAAAKLVGGDDGAEDRAEEFAERAEAHRAKVEEAAHRSDYEHAAGALVETYAEMPENAQFQLRFANGETFLDGAIAVGTNLKSDGTGSGRMLYTEPVEFDEHGPPATVTEAWLIASSGETRRCEVTPGLHVGAGRHARIPPDNLIF